MMNMILREPSEELRRKMDLKEFAEIRDRIRAVLNASGGMSAAGIAEELDRSERWAQEWVYRYRDEGFEGLWDHPRSGAPPKVAPEELLPAVARILDGPRTEDNVTVFTGKIIQKILESEFRVFYSLPRVYELLHAWGLSSLIPRPKHEKNDPEMMAAWLREAPRIVRQIKKHPEKIIQIWFLDEMRFGMKGFLRRCWLPINFSPVHSSLTVEIGQDLAASLFARRLSPLLNRMPDTEKPVVVLEPETEPSRPAKAESISKFSPCSREGNRNLWSV